MFKWLPWQQVSHGTILLCDYDRTMQIPSGYLRLHYSSIREIKHVSIGLMRHKNDLFMRSLYMLWQAVNWLHFF